MLIKDAQLDWVKLYGFAASRLRYIKDLDNAKEIVHAAWIDLANRNAEAANNKHAHYILCQRIIWNIIDAYNQRKKSVMDSRDVIIFACQKPCDIKAMETQLNAEGLLKLLYKRSYTIGTTGEALIRYNRYNGDYDYVAEKMGVGSNIIKARAKMIKEYLKDYLTNN